MLAAQWVYGYRRGSAAQRSTRGRDWMLRKLMMAGAALTLSALIGMPAVAADAMKPGKMSLSSPDIAPGATIKDEQVFKGFGCTGGNISPALSWKGAPAGTKSFALSVYDPDAPTGSGFWRWVVYNIPASATSLAAGAGDPAKKLLPAGATQGNTDFGAPGY